MKATSLVAALTITPLIVTSGVLLAQSMGGGNRSGMSNGMAGGMHGVFAVQVPPDNSITVAKVALGKQLFFDARLSKDGTVSCNTCHDLKAGGADNKPVSIGVGGAQGSRNAPTVWNAAFHSAQFLDGRAASLEDQAKGPLTNPVEMAMPSLDAVVARVKGIPGYVSQFDAVFGKTNAVTIDNIAKAIATYERTLISGNSPFDEFRFNDQAVLSESEWQGFQTFREVGCVQCHMGPDFAGPPPLARGAGFYQKFPLFLESALLAKYKLLDDLGRFNATGQAGDQHVWRVPSLLNIKSTAPYFHNGQVPTLEEAVRVCAAGGNNLELTQTEVKSITAFLGSLSGVLPEQSKPRLP